MVDSVTSQTLFTGEKRAAFVFTNVSDGTGEAGVAKIDISTLVGNPSKVKITRVEGNTSGMSVSVLFDHTTDDRVLVLNEHFEHDFRPWGGLQDPASEGGTGDILFTTNGATAGDTYCIMMEVELS